MPVENVVFKENIQTIRKEILVDKPFDKVVTVVKPGRISDTRYQIPATRYKISDMLSHGTQPSTRPSRDAGEIFRDVREI